MAKKNYINKFIQTLPDDQMIKVGSKNGCGWWYVGQVSDFIKKMTDISLELQKSLKSAEKAAERNLDSKLRNWPTPERYTRFQLRKNDFEKSLTYNAYNAWLTGWFISVAKQKKAVIKAKENTKSFIELSKREVIETSKADEAIEEDCILILVEGVEDGMFWSTDEAEKLPAIGIRGPISQENDLTIPEMEEETE